MIPLTAYRDKRLYVFGLGASGLSAARALKAGKARLAVWDDDAGQRQAAEAEGFLCKEPGDVDFGGLDAVVLSPGIPLTHPEPHAVVIKAQAAGTAVIGDMELFQVQIAQASPRPPVVAITGTNGKSTTTALLGHVLKRAGFDAQIGGNIGQPVLDLAPPQRNLAYVLEVSSYQIDLAPSLHPDVGVLLNITPDHLDRHGSLDNYAAVKARLFANQGRDDTAVVGVDTERARETCTRLCGSKRMRVWPVSVGKALGRGVNVIDGTLYDNTGSKAMAVGDLNDAKHLPGAHNWENAAAAYAAARALLIERDRAFEGLMTFTGLAHRMELIAEQNGVRYVNDSKATNADATAKALGSYDAIYWIAGGRAKAGGLAPLGDELGNVRHAYLIGEAAGEFAADLEGRVPASVHGDLDRALATARGDAERAAKEGDAPVVLLSPAAASFDQYRNFEVRGDAFRALVLQSEAPTTPAETAEGGAAA